MIVMRNFGKNSEEFGSVKERTHMTVKVCRVDTCRDSMFDLCPDFALRFFGLDMGGGGGRFRPKITRRIEQTRNFGRNLPPPPPISSPQKRSAESGQDQKSNRLNSSHQTLTDSV